MRAILVAGLFTLGMMGVAAATPHQLNTDRLDTATAGAMTLPGGELGLGPIVAHPVGPTPRPIGPAPIVPPIWRTLPPGFNPGGPCVACVMLPPLAGGLR